MYPDQQSQQTPIDYLNQIAPQPQKSKRVTPVRLILIAAGALVVIVLFSFIAGLFVHSTKNDLETLSAKLSTTSTLASKAQNTIRDSNLQSLNVTLQLYLSNTTRDITTPLKNAGVNTAKIDKSILDKEKGTDISQKLEDARLNAVYDNTYANEMSYQLSTIVNLMQQIYNTTSDTTLKAFLHDAYNNLTPIQKQFSEYNSTDS